MISVGIRRFGVRDLRSSVVAQNMFSGCRVFLVDVGDRDQLRWSSCQTAPVLLELSGIVRYTEDGGVVQM